MFLLWFILLLVAILYVAAMFRALWLEDGQPIPQLRIPFLNLIDEPEEVAVIFVVLGILTAVVAYAIMNQWIMSSWITLRGVVKDYQANIVMECLSIGITVLIIERLYERRSKTGEKKALISQLSKAEHLFAIEALRQLRERNWLTDGTLIGADLTLANLVAVDLSRANLSRVNLCGAKLTDAKLAGANLGEALLSVAMLNGADMFATNLRRANLSGARLIGATLSAANLDEANLRSAIYDLHTQWPEGFSPKAAGAIEVQWDEAKQGWIPVDETGNQT